MLNKPRWDLRSRWTLRQQQSATKSRPGCLFEHEVTVSSASSSVELVARFVHAVLPQGRSNSGRPLGRGGLVSIVIRKRRQRQHHAGIKCIDARALHSSLKLQPRLKAIDSVSPQSRAAISGSSSPVAAPLALSANPGIVPIVPSSEPIKEDIGSAPALPSPASILPDQNCAEINVAPCLAELPADASVAQTIAWLRSRGFQAFESTFANFSASDILRLSRDDLIQICGLANGIRLFNALHSKAPQPKLSLYFAVEPSAGGAAGGLWRIVYLESLTSAALTGKLLAALNLPRERLHSVLLLGPQGIHVLVTNELVANMKDESMFVVETIKEPGTDRYKLLLKPSSTH